MRKNALPFLFAWFLICAIAAPGTIYAADLQIERLTWAGVKLVSDRKIRPYLSTQSAKTCGMAMRLRALFR